jgi:hypothetical protein
MLKTCRGMFAKELTDEEVRVWNDFLREYSLPELRYAFENWVRNSRFFPKPKDIVDLVEAFRVTQKDRSGYPGCDDQCKSRHFRGYGENDVKWLMKRCEMMKDMTDPQATKRMTESEIEQLLSELDSKREGGAPEWRRNRV